MLVGWKNAAMSQLIVAVAPTLFTAVIAGATRTGGLNI